MSETGATYNDRQARFAAAKPAALTFLLVFACFTLSSSGYLAWLYHLMALAPPASVDALSMGAGYLCQALGIGIAAACLRAWPGLAGRVPLVAAIALNFACTAPAAMGDTLGATMAFGYAMNLLCGVIAAFYLLCLASLVREGRRGIVFGGGYACSIVVSWLVSMALGTSGDPLVQLATCGACSVLAIVVGMVVPLGADSQLPLPSRPPATPAVDVKWGILAMAGITVLLMSMVKNMGFNFPSGDIGAAVDLEFSRLFYAVGLLVAGLIVDRNRKHGSILCMAALVTPFALMAISGEPVSSMVLWAVDYFFYGFFSVFRVVLFADLAEWGNRPYLSGFGLMFGRMGDALGTLVCMTLAGSTVVLVGVAGGLFVACVFAFYRLFQHLFAPAPVVRSEREVFEAFAVQHDLSPREREVLRLLLDGRTNAEAAAELFVAESTVKFHVRNLLKKTGCANRSELLALYAAERG